MLPTKAQVIEFGIGLGLTVGVTVAVAFQGLDPANPEGIDWTVFRTGTAIATAKAIGTYVIAQWGARAARRN